MIKEPTTVATETATKVVSVHLSGEVVEIVSRVVLIRVPHDFNSDELDGWTADDVDALTERGTWYSDDDVAYPDDGCTVSGFQVLDHLRFGLRWGRGVEPSGETQGEIVRDDEGNLAAA